MLLSFWNPVWFTIKVSVAATLLSLIIACGLSWLMKHHFFRGKVLVETMLMLPLVVPPTTIGLLIIVLFGRQTGLGRFLEETLHIHFLFSYEGAVLATTIVAFPFMYQILKTGFLSIDSDLEDAAKCDGANQWQLFWQIQLPLIQKFVLAAAVLGFTRSTGEFGAVLMVAGNIPGKTQTISTAMYTAFESGNDMLALLWAGCSIFLSFSFLLLTHRLSFSSR